jgi:hypothetical protein
MKYRARLQIFLCVFFFLFLASCSFRLTEDQARAHAIDKLEKYCKNFKIDRSLVKGPEYLGSFADGYSFQWVAYLPKEGKTNIDIFVSYDGAVELTTEKAADIKN